LSVSAISKRYARALIELGSEKKKVEPFADEMNRVLAAFTEEEALPTVLESPTYSYEKRSAILQDLAKQLKLSPMIKNFLGLLLEKNRLRFLPQIQKDYRKFADEISGVLRARVTSAAEIDPEQAKVIRSTLEKQTGKKVELETQVDPSLIGGLRAEIGGKVFDGSLLTQLSRIEDNLKKG
jgi:F-type H+-transporting ATPase subunit delta